jgi:hypothetical protein
MFGGFLKYQWVGVQDYHMSQNITDHGTLSEEKRYNFRFMYATLAYLNKRFDVLKTFFIDYKSFKSIFS